MAQSTCDVLSHGRGANQALSLITKKTKWSVKEASDFGGMVAYAYCKDSIPGASKGEPSRPATTAGPQLPEQPRSTRP